MVICSPTPNAGLGWSILAVFAEITSDTRLASKCIPINMTRARFLPWMLTHQIAAQA